MTTARLAGAHAGGSRTAAIYRRCKVTTSHPLLASPRRGPSIPPMTLDTWVNRSRTTRMGNPWLDIPLEEYEGHMALPAIAQAKLLADQFERLMARHLPASVAVIGCAGGNGFDRIDPGRIKRVVAIDVNPAYVGITGARYSRRFSALELLCADVQSESLRFEPVDFMYAALIFEFVDVSLALRSMSRNCRQGTILATVLQLPSPGEQPVSPSPFRSLDALAPAMTLVAPEDLRQLAIAAGFVSLDTESAAAPSGKSFCVQVFRS